MNTVKKTEEYTEVPTRMEFDLLRNHTEGHCAELATLRGHAEKMGDAVVTMIERQDQMEQQELLTTVLFNMHQAIFAAMIRRLAEKENVGVVDINIDLTERALQIAKNLEPDLTSPIGKAVKQSNDLTIEALEKRVEELRRMRDEP